MMSTIVARQKEAKVLAKKIVIAIALGSLFESIYAAEVELSDAVNDFQIKRMPFGSGTPAAAITDGTETAMPVADGLYHAPNYLPGFPTAATIWPRELPVDCQRDATTGKPICAGFEVYPATGRGEYLFVRPTLKTAPAVAAPLPVMPVIPAIPVTQKKPLG